MDTTNCIVLPAQFDRNSLKEKIVYLPYMSLMNIDGKDIITFNTIDAMKWFEEIKVNYSLTDCSCVSIARSIKFLFNSRNDDKFIMYIFMNQHAFNSQNRKEHIVRSIGLNGMYIILKKFESRSGNENKIEEVKQQNEIKITTNSVLDEIINDFYENEKVNQQNEIKLPEVKLTSSQLEEISKNKMIKSNEDVLEAVVNGFFYKCRVIINVLDTSNNSRFSIISCDKVDDKFKFKIRINQSNDSLSVWIRELKLNCLININQEDPNFITWKAKDDILIYSTKLNEFKNLKRYYKSQEKYEIFKQYCNTSDNEYMMLIRN